MTCATELTLFIYPPLAFARLGGSASPLDAYHWGPNDNSVTGSGKTTVMPAPTLTVAEDGTLSCSTPAEVVFKDANGFRPVCPFFELWGRWGNGENACAPITPVLLVDRFRLHESQLRWTVEVANLKPYFMTRDWQTRIHARVELRGGDPKPKDLEGVSPIDAPNPLVPHGAHIPLGSVRLTRANKAFPGLRLRFRPGRGQFFGPPNLLERWKGVKFPTKNLFLNPASLWCRWKPSQDDPRGWPPGQYAQDDDGVSYGIVDDVCDGIITCAIDGVEHRDDLQVIPAHARIVVGPPDYAPDRRPFVSLADGLKDRVERNLPDAYFADTDLVRLEIGDLMERVFETMGLINLDVFNDRVNVLENQLIALENGLPYRPSDARAFPPLIAMGTNPLPLTERGRQHHRRYVVPDVLEDFIRKNPGIIEKWVRPPLGDEPFFDWKMPALMKDASGTPLHLTRRQYELLIRWAKSLRDAR